MEWIGIESHLSHWISCPVLLESKRTFQGKPVSEIKCHIACCNTCPEDCEWSWKNDKELRQRMRRLKKEYDERNTGQTGQEV
jgi:hypothetical protein